MSGTPYTTGLEDGDDFGLDEQERLRAWYRDEHGNGDADLARFAPFLLDHRPRSLKRYRRHAEAVAGLDGLPAAGVVLLYAYAYLLAGYERGVVYELIAARRWGAKKAEALDVIELAVVDGGAMAAETACATDALLRAWADDAPDTGASPWPNDWPTGEPAVRIGSEGPYIALLEREAPAAARTYRARLDAAARDFTLPAALVPLMRLTAAAFRGRSSAAVAAMREAQLLGVPRRTVIAALAWASFGADQQVLDKVAIEAAALLSGWPDAATQT